jgi:hypothetical protein
MMGDSKPGRLFYKVPKNNRKKEKKDLFWKS